MGVGCSRFAVANRIANMERPQKPDLSKYGITAEDLKAYKKLRELEGKPESKGSLWAAFPAYILFALFAVIPTAFMCVVIYVFLVMIFFALLIVGIVFGIEWLDFLHTAEHPMQSNTVENYWWVLPVLVYVGMHIPLFYDAVKTRRETANAEQEILHIRKQLSREVVELCEKWSADYEKYDYRLREYRRHRDKKRAEKRRQEESFWSGLSGRAFEKEFAGLLRKKGYKAKATKSSGDDGIDVVGSKDGVPLVVQCKAWKHTVSPSTVREFIGAWTMHNGKSGEGWFVALGGFTKGARQTAIKSRVKMLDVKGVIDFACEEDA